MYSMAKTRQINKKEIKKIKLDFEKYDIDLSKHNRFEIVSYKKDILITDKQVVGFYYENKLYPSLNLILQKETNIPCVYLDMGAVPFIVKGADIMRPGIKEVDNFESGDLVILKDWVHKKPLALGISLFSSEDIKKMTKNKVIKNIHYIGDYIWDYNKNKKG